jgi:hypothetical protein
MIPAEPTPAQLRQDPLPLLGSTGPGLRNELGSLTCTNTGVSDGIRTRDIQDRELTSPIGRDNLGRAASAL